LFVRLYDGVLVRADEDWADPDPKSALQEFAPESVQYSLLEQTGPDHRRWFRVQVTVAGRALGEGEGSSKKKAEQAAARIALRMLRNQ
jgi:ribonuclease-3